MLNKCNSFDKMKQGIVSYGIQNNTPLTANLAAILTMTDLFYSQTGYPVYLKVP